MTPGVRDLGRERALPKCPDQGMVRPNGRGRNLKVTLHALRHTHVSSLIAAGVDILTISRRLGHASPTITLGVYGHLFSNTDDRAAQVIEAMFARVME